MISLAVIGSRGLIKHHLEKLVALQTKYGLPPLTEEPDTNRDISTLGVFDLTCHRFHIEQSEEASASQETKSFLQEAQMIPNVLVMSPERARVGPRLQESQEVVRHVEPTRVEQGPRPIWIIVGCGAALLVSTAGTIILPAATPLCLGLNFLIGVNFGIAWMKWDKHKRSDKAQHKEVK